MCDGQTSGTAPPHSGAFSCILKESRKSIQMQLTNSATIVDFFPEAFIAEADEVKGMKVVIKRFNKRVTFRANGQKSYSTITFTTFKNEVAERIAKGAEVTDFNTEKMDRSEYMPMAC